MNGINAELTYSSLLESGQNADWDKYYESDSASFDLEDLFNYLDDIAPEGHYFGANPGDGANYGFWAVEDL